MPGPTIDQDRIKEEFSIARKEYAAFDRTLSALAALRFVLQDVREIHAETEEADFRPRLEASEGSAVPCTPDGLIRQKLADLILELKTSWDDKDIEQVVKYASCKFHLSADGKRHPLKPQRCLLLGYQNPPGELPLAKLFDAWHSRKFDFPLVVFRYSLDLGPEGDRIYFVRVPFRLNGDCPTSGIGRIFNLPQGFHVKTDHYRQYRSKFHRSNDQVIASYAAVIWWTKYAQHYLSEEQRAEMADRGRLTSPLVIPQDRLHEVPTLPGVDVPLGPTDVRHALEFLRQAKLVELRKSTNSFEIVLKTDRYIRLPQDSPVSRSGQDISIKILARWATHKIKNPTPKHQIGRPKKRPGIRSRSRGGGGSDWLPFSNHE